MPNNTLWTVGHSTRSLDDFLALLSENQIETLADVRRFPGSRRYPHFNSETLAAALAKAGIMYQHFPALGGRRTAPTEATPNSAWRVAAFAAYADYLLTDDFKTAFKELSAVAEHSRTAIAGERLELRDKAVLVNGRVLGGDWGIHHGPALHPPGKLRASFRSLVVPAGTVFVLGDNRDSSYDSRFYGPIPISLLRARPLFLYWAADKSRIGTYLR